MIAKSTIRTSRVHADAITDTRAQKWLATQ